MCGIFGVVVPGVERLSDADLHRARTACDTLRHRGPDQYGEYTSANVYSGHRRLSIIDLSERGRQPMVADDGSVAISVNGEIYNFRKLRRELGEEKFRSNSDSETILHGYRSWGLPGLLERLEGMFAFSVVDRARCKAYLVRDHAGIKPLYFGSIGGYTFWASELKAVKSFFERDQLAIDYTALYDFLTYRYIPAPKTLFRGCHKLEAGHFAEIDLARGDCKTCRYWQVSASEVDSTMDRAARDIRELIASSVDEQLVSDVPVGFFLSGGMDSSVVVAEAASRHNELATFSIGYDVESHDETSYADMVANRFKTAHSKRILDANCAEDVLRRMESWYDEPFADTSALPTHQVASFARESVTVVLTGDGGDELFGGYRWYERFRRFRRLQSMLSMGDRFGHATNLSAGRTGIARKILSRFDLLSRFDPLELYVTLLGGYIAAEKREYRREFGIDDDYDDLWHFRRYYDPQLPVRKRMQYLDFHTYLPDDILTKVDRVTMAVSLEARVPLLSRSVIEYAFNLPESVLYYRGMLKGALKRAYDGTLPDTIIHRAKKGFSIPLHEWDRSLKQDVRRVLDLSLLRYLAN